MQKEAVLYGIIGLLAGSLFTIFVTSYSVNNNMTGMMRMMGMSRGADNMMQQELQEPDTGDIGMMGMGSSMNQMMESLGGKTGDDFDEAFISAMIAHHEGAIEMAEEALVSAKHDEIKNLAEDIISAQTSEIEQMMEWKNTWGY